MNKSGILFLLISLLVLLSGCKKKFKECPFDIHEIDFTFGIDYDNPETYLIAGEQSELSQDNFDIVSESVGPLNHEIEDVLELCSWVNTNFRFQNEGGRMIGVYDVNGHFEDRKFFGCHSQSLIISSVLRSFGFPTLMIETADIQWAIDEYNNDAGNMIGHVMTEVFVGGQWILLDNNCKYVKNYDPGNPYISQLSSSQKGWFVFAKGIDIWDYANKDEDFTNTEMMFFSDNVHCYQELFYTISYSWK